MKPRLRLLAPPTGVCLLLAALATAACASGEGAAPAPGAHDGELLVAAAADLRPAFDEVGTLFERETAATLTFSYGSSGLLASQIEGGLPADIYASADIEYVDRLRQEGLIIEDTQQVYAVGRLALASSTKAGLTLSDPQDLLQPEVRQVAIANPQHAPYGRAAEEALKSLGLWDELKPKLVYGENVRQAMQYVQSANAEAGFVALSLAVAAPDVTYVLVDASLHQPIRQALAVVAGTKHEGLARRFIDLLTGPQGRAILEKYGFSVSKEE